MQGICNNGQCVNAQGGFQCECKQGYALDDEGKNCLGRQQKRYHDCPASISYRGERHQVFLRKLWGGFSARTISRGAFSKSVSQAVIHVAKVVLVLQNLGTLCNVDGDARGYA